MLNPADDAFATRLRELLPDQVFRDLTPAYLEDSRGLFEGQPGLLLAPENTEQVSTIIKACAEARVGVIPYGGGTGLVGGQVMPDGPKPVILSLERMKAIRAVYPRENVIVVEAGAILADVQAAAAAEDRLFPLSLAAEGSARIGGNLATNAGGVNVLRYGNARDLCLGIEAVMPNGSIYNGLTRLRKDNTGYDIRNLLVGSEGTLGVITAAALKLYPQPEATGAALLVVESPEAALDLLAMARRRMGDGVSAFELIAQQSLVFLEQTMPDVRQPFAEKPEWMVLIDLGLSAGQDPQDALEGLFVEAAEAELVSDGVIAQSEAQRQDFWNIRESIPDANRKIGAISSQDISLPLTMVPEFIRQAPARLAEVADIRINCFGHLGDGNLHYNAFPAAGRARADYTDARLPIKKVIHDIVVEMGGSISAEHGIGRLKTADLAHYGDPTKLAAIRAIKAALDPVGIMNPGVIVPLE